MYILQGVLQDPLDGLQDPLLFKNYASEIGPSIGSPVGVLQDPFDGLQDPLLFKNYASEIGPYIGSPVGVLQDPFDGLQDPLFFKNYASEIGPSIGSPVVCSSYASHPPEHVEFRNPICAVVGEGETVIRQERWFLTTANITSIFCDLIDPLDPFPTHNYLDKVNIEDYDILLGALCENNNHWCLLVIYPQSRELLYLNPLGEQKTHQDQYLQNWLLFISERHNRGIRRNPSFSLEWSIVTRKHRKQLDSSSCGVFTLKFSEHVLTDNDFMFDSSKRAIRASTHIIGQVLVDNSVGYCLINTDIIYHRTCLQCQSLTSAMCDDFGTMPMTITRGFSSVKGQNLATLFDVHVKHKQKEVIEMTELQGSASYYSAQWRHIRWITDISLAKHMEMRKGTAGICERQNIFGNTAGKELYALVLAEFSEWKIKSIQMSQNMNSGTRYFKDVLFVEAEILVVSHIKKITVPEADRLLHPLPSLKR
ncbi:unnamed protein product [Mytilus coruscus]|uniref:Ubiquitin-like protease family profile domain-containing protein n=1 Tax=Mytilus coruscus TaxID=42192 RepID=A0A6J7ZZL2_MYTCO|nr:unnamed protein product [Mytilus coruscus]